MPEKSEALANLARIGKLAIEPGTPGEIKGLRCKKPNQRDRGI